MRDRISRARGPGRVPKRPIALLLGAIAVATGLAGAAAADGHDEAFPVVLGGDFDASGAVDIADFLMFREAYGGTDLKYDLDGDGRVGLLDLFVIADLVEGVLTALPPATDAHPDLLPQKSAPARTVVLNRGEARITFPDYAIVVSHGNPFGITSLKLTEQPVDFANGELPLADWEWFWYEDPQLKARSSVKLLQADWGFPRVEESDEAVVLSYRRFDDLRKGIELEVVFRLSAARPQFDVTYTIRNNSESSLTAPYVMLGFPGFANHRWVSGVANAEADRKPRIPSYSFLTEALGQDREEYLLLRHDVRPEPGEIESLRGDVAMTFAGQVYTLSSFFLSMGQDARLYSAHTNKPRYLTSHLYVTTRDIAVGASRTLTVLYIAAAGVY